MQKHDQHRQHTCFSTVGCKRSNRAFPSPLDCWSACRQSGTVPCPDLPLLLQDRFPGTIRIESIHFNKLIEGGRPKILLVDNAVVADDEGLHAGHAVLSGSSDQGEAADHYTLHDKIHFADWCRGSLTFQNLEEIAMISLCAV